MEKWTKNGIPEVASKLRQNILNSFHIESEEQLSNSSRKTIHEILDDILAVLFPGAFANEMITIDSLDYFLNDKLTKINFSLSKQITDIMTSGNSCSAISPSDKKFADSASQRLIEELPNIRLTLLDDVKAAMEGDPAASSLREILLSYPCIETIATHRVAHLLYNEKISIIPRIMSERAHSKSGVDIHPGASIGKNFFIDHGTGIVIGETATIGNNVKIYQGVTLGATSPFDKDGKPKTGQKRHPDIEDDVIIYANATILGGQTVIGKGSIIGGNTWVIKSVPPMSKIYNS